MGNLIQWKEEYSIGQDDIDAEHKKMFEMANKIFQIQDPAGDRTTIMLLLHELYDYVQTHFQHEEEYMKKMAYSGLNDHREKHQEIIQEMNLCVKNSHDMAQLTSSLDELLTKWVLTHIIEEDRQIPHSN